MSRSNPNTFYQVSNNKAYASLLGAWKPPNRGRDERARLVWLRFDLRREVGGVRAAWTYCGDVMEQAAEYLGQPPEQRAVTVNEVRSYFPATVKKALAP